MKTNFKKYMGVDRPFEPKPLPPPKEPHPVPKGYKRVKDGSFNKLLKIDEALDHVWSTHLLDLYKRDIFSKNDLIKTILQELKENGGDDIFGSIEDVIRVFRREGFDWSEFKTIEKFLKEGATPDETITITLGVRGDTKKKLAQLLHSISTSCAMGCSRTWGMLDGDRGEGAKVDFDGDGADQLIDVKIDGKSVKDLI